jgi:hypothetical protein
LEGRKEIEMKQICLVALTLSLLVLPRPLLGQMENSDGSPVDGLGSSGPETTITTGVPCKAGGVIVAQADPEEQGECRCPPMLGTVTSGCAGYSRLDCQLKTCHYKDFDVESGRVSDEGDIDCEWHPGGVQ